MSEMKITIMKNGPYHVEGGITPRLQGIVFVLCP